MCDELKMSNKNIIVGDVRIRWNSTYDMIKAAWEKKISVEGNGERPSNTNKVNFLIEDSKWELLKMFVDELLAFREANEIFSKSKSITIRTLWTSSWKIRLVNFWARSLLVLHLERTECAPAGGGACRREGRDKKEVLLK